MMTNAFVLPKIIMKLGRFIKLELDEISGNNFRVSIIIVWTQMSSASEILFSIKRCDVLI